MIGITRFARFAGLAHKYVSPEPPPGPDDVDKGAYWSINDALDLVFGPAPEADEGEPAGP